MSAVENIDLWVDEVDGSCACHVCAPCLFCTQHNEFDDNGKMVMLTDEQLDAFEAGLIRFQDGKLVLNDMNKEMKDRDGIESITASLSDAVYQEPYFPIRALFDRLPPYHLGGAFGGEL